MLWIPPRISGSIVSPLILAAAAVVLSAAPALAPPALAQSLWMPRDHGSAGMFELLKPVYDDIDEDFPTFSSFIGLRSKPKDKISIVAEASLARLGFEDISSFSLGNVYLGVEYGNAAGPWFGEFGVRVPTSSESEIEARLTGFLSDLVRQEAWLSKTVTFQGAVNLRRVMASGFYYRLRLSPSIVASTQDTGGDNVELFAIYSGQLGMEAQSVRAGVGLIARTWITQSDLEGFSGRTQTQLDAHVDFCSGSLRPGIEVKTLLDDELNDIVPVTVGVSLSYSK
jgi:hypothetical protein